VNCFAWPDKPDIMVTLNEDIILSSEVNVVPLNNRGPVGLTKDDLKEVDNWMVFCGLHSFYFATSAQYCIFKKGFSNLNFILLNYQVAYFIPLAKRNKRESSCIFHSPCYEK
jgi:hypothetical protein